MKYKLLGKTGLRVSEICLGTMTFGKDWGWGSAKEESKKIFDHYANANGNFLDTANLYTNGTSEKYLGEFIKNDRDHFVVATKYTLTDDTKDPNFSGNHRKNMMRSVEHSLKRLNTDFIDILYLHIWDFITPIEEILRGIDDLVSSGKILYAGISDTPAWIVSEANTLADIRGWTRFNALQVEYSLIERSIERDLLPMAQAKNMSVLAWAPLGAGILTGKYFKQNDDPKRIQADSKKLNERNQKITQEVLSIAEEIQCLPEQVAIQWMIKKHPIVIPIIGARTEKQLKNNLNAIDIQLQDTHMERLEKVSHIPLGFPHNFLQLDQVKQFVYGSKYDNIERR